MTGTIAQSNARKAAVLAELAAGGFSVDVARKHGLAVAYVRHLASDAGIKLRGRPSRKDFRLRAIMREFHALGRSQADVCRMTAASKVTVCRVSREMGLKFPKDTKHCADVIAARKSKAAVMAALYRDGYTLEQIGVQYGITRERVRQILKKDQRMTGSDGGRRARSETLRAKLAASQDAKYMLSHGCTFAQYKEVRKLGRGVARERGPLGAFGRQRLNASKRSIGWELTFWQWWTIWQQSGHWDQRGRGQGYVMCRKGDTGPYAVGNVYIATAIHNSATAKLRKKKDPDLPIGVKRTKSGRYLAKRNVNGKKLRLGTHATPELAYAAYLMAAPDEARAA